METTDPAEPLPRLSAEELRVLGVLSEKGLATPQNYPLSLSALTTGCNQSTGREPVTDYDEVTVREALGLLTRRGLVARQTGAGSRVEKFRTQLARTYRLTAAHETLVAGLMLRGSQTAGELRSRWKRMHDFDSLDEVQAGLTELAERTPPLVASLAQAPATRGERWTHLFAPVQTPEPATNALQPPTLGGTLADRIERQEARIAGLEAELAELRSAFDAFRTQFE